MSFKSLLAYQKAFDLAMTVFYLSKSFPAEERFSLTSQIIRSSRGVCSAIAEAYRKRSYEKHLRVN
jgi:four helix bundle protein